MGLGSRGNFCSPRCLRLTLMLQVVIFLKDMVIIDGVEFGVE